MNKSILGAANLWLQDRAVVTISAEMLLGGLLGLVAGGVIGSKLSHDTPAFGAVLGSAIGVGAGGIAGAVIATKQLES